MGSKGILKIILGALIVSFFLSGIVFAGTTGKIAGYIKDAKTGDPLPGVNVIIEGTLMGASSDPNGYYVILNVPVGVYTLRAKMIGYKEVVVENVKVTVDLTTWQDFELEPTVIVGEVVTVTAERPLVERDVTMSRTLYEKSRIENLPATSVSRVMELTSGYVRGSFRGGRINTGEVVMYVDGISLHNPIGWGRVSGRTAEGSQELATRLSPLAIEEMEVITGGFNAEYGNAQSAVVNLLTKEGGKRHTGEIRYTMDLAALPDLPIIGKKPGECWPTAPRKYYRWIEDDPLYKNVVQGWYKDKYLEWTLGGPEPITTYLLKDLIPGDLTYHIAGDYRHITIARFTPDRSIPPTKFNHNNNAHFLTSKPDQFTYTVNGKLTYKPSAALKFTLSGLRSERVDLPYTTDPIVTSGEELMGCAFNEMTGEIDTSIVIVDSLVVKYPDFATAPRIPVVAYDKSKNFLTREFWSNYIGLSITHTLSARTFYDVALSFFETCMNEYMRDPVTGEILDYWDNDWRGFDAQRFLQNRLPITGIVNASVMHVYRGREAVRQKTYTLRSNITSQVTDKHQLKAGIEARLYNLYLIDRGVASGGNDYNDKYHRKPWYLAAYVQDKMELLGMVVNIGYRVDVISPEAEYPADYLDPIGELLPDGTHKIKNPKKTKPRAMFSPRLGVSFPITAIDAIHFTYGHYYQFPPFDRYYTNVNYDLRGAFHYIGNPNIKPEKTVSYEFGWEHQIIENLGFDITGFYKDVYDLIDTQKIIDNQGRNMYYYHNYDYSNVKGVEVTLTKRYSHNFSGQISYTLQWAMSRTNSLTQSFSDLYHSRAPRTKFYRSNFDQRHTINVNFDYRVPDGWGPTVLGVKPFDDWGLNILFRCGSGNPFSSPAHTPVPPVNDDNWPWWFQTDLRFNKDFKIFDWAKLSFFTQISNVFNDTRIWSAANIEWYQLTRDGKAWYWTAPRNMGGEYKKWDKGPDVEGTRYPNPRYKGSARRIWIGLGIKFL